MEGPDRLPRLVAGPAGGGAPDVSPDLALDEVLALRAEPVARVWRPPARAAVIGVGSKAAAELDLEACRAGGLRVLRRMTGGAAVLVTPEVACFSLVFPHALFPAAKKISGAYALATRLAARALEALGLAPEFHPPGDLAIAGRKLVGLAQARRRHSTLVHGVIPVSLELEDLERYIAAPPDEPAYRQGRPHREFVTTVAMSVDRASARLSGGQARESFRGTAGRTNAPEGRAVAKAPSSVAELLRRTEAMARRRQLPRGPWMEEVLSALGTAFCGRGARGEPPREDELAAAASLARAKYANDEWTFRR